MPEELEVISKNIELITWYLNFVEKMPRSHRYGIGARIENKLFELLDLLTQSKFSQSKIELLRQAGFRVEEIRLLLRVTHRLRLISNRRFSYAVKELSQIGVGVRRWLRYHEQRASADSLTQS